MANQSIYSAFERMWEHTSVADSEIRGLISELAERFNALAESDDTTLDTLKEIVEYIKSNRTLIESITTTKVNVDDIINDLITNEPKKPLSAAQGKALKDLIDALQTAINNITIPVTSVNNKTGAVNLTASDVGALPSTTTIPTKISELTNDSEFATEQYVDEEIEDHDTSPLAHANKMNSQNPVGEGSFSMNRDPDTVIGNNSFAEGMMTEASGDYSHAEGNNTTAEGRSSHAEGDSTEALGDYSHTEGRDTIAHGAYSHVEGYRNSAYEDYMHVQGKFSKSATNAAHVVGNGSEDQSSNAHTLDWDGNAWFSGDVYVGSTSGTNKDEGSKKLATEEYVDNAIENLPTASTSEYGVTKLSSSTSSTSTTLAATPSAVKAAYDLANNAKPLIIEFRGDGYGDLVTKADSGKLILCKYYPEGSDEPLILSVNEIQPCTTSSSGATTGSLKFAGMRGTEAYEVGFTYMRTPDTQNANGSITMGRQLTAWGPENIYSLLDKSGGDMTGLLTLASDPTENLHAATKQYVDNATANIDLSTKVSKSGDTMTGPIEFSGTSNAIDFDTSGWIRGKTTSGSRYDIFGYSNPTTLQVGGTYPALSLKGKNTRPTYNDAEMALLSDVSSDIFIAEYNVTPYEDMLAAYNAGKMLFCKYTNDNGKLLMLPFLSNDWSGMHLFAFSGNDTVTLTVVGYYPSSDIWVSTTYGVAVKNSETNVLNDTLVARNNTNYTTKQVRNIILVADGEEIPAGANGDICLVYAP